MMTAFSLRDLKPLTSAARDDARARALRRVQKLAGERPNRAQFSIEHAPLVGVLDYLAGFVFVSALSISSLNIVAHMGRLAAEAYAPSPAGIAIPRGTATIIFQVASVPLAEFSMIAFLVAFGMTRGWRRWAYLLLAALATVFILFANMSSHVGTFESALPALFTIGTGLRLEALLAEQLKRRAEVQTRYREALSAWERAQVDPSQHPAYPALLREELWAKLVSYAANRGFVDAPIEFKRAAVQREIEAMQWSHDAGPFHDGGRPTRSSASGANGAERRLELANMTAVSAPIRAANNGTMHGVETHE